MTLSLNSGQKLRNHAKAKVLENKLFHRGHLELLRYLHYNFYGQEIYMKQNKNYACRWHKNLVYDNHSFTDYLAVVDAD